MSYSFGAVLVTRMLYLQENRRHKIWNFRRMGLQIMNWELAGYWLGLIV